MINSGFDAIAEGIHDFNFVLRAGLERLKIIPVYLKTLTVAFL